MISTVQLITAVLVLIGVCVTAVMSVVGWFVYQAAQRVIAADKVSARIMAIEEEQMQLHDIITRQNKQRANSKSQIAQAKGGPMTGEQLEAFRSSGALPQ